MGYIKKEGDGNLIYNVVNQDPEAEGTRHSTFCFWAFSSASIFTVQMQYAIFNAGLHSVLVGLKKFNVILL